MGRPRRDGRQMLNGILWILCSGALWHDLPERYGPWKTVYQRFRQWREDDYIDLDIRMVGSTSIRATRSANGAGKRGIYRTERSCAWP